MATSSLAYSPPAFLFDLDGTLVDSVYQHVLALREALEHCSIIWMKLASGYPVVAQLEFSRGKCPELLRRSAVDWLYVNAV